MFQCSTDNRHSSGNEIKMKLISLTGIIVVAAGEICKSASRWIRKQQRNIYVIIYGLKGKECDECQSVNRVKKKDNKKAPTTGRLVVSILCFVHVYIQPYIICSIMYHVPCIIAPRSPFSYPVHCRNFINRLYSHQVGLSYLLFETQKWISCPCKKWHKIYRILNVERVHWFTHTDPHHHKKNHPVDGIWFGWNRKELIARQSLNNTLHPKLNPVSSQPHPITMNKEMAKIVVHWKNVCW